MSEFSILPQQQAELLGIFSDLAGKLGISEGELLRLLFRLTPVLPAIAIARAGDGGGGAEEAPGQGAVNPMFADPAKKTLAPPAVFMYQTIKEDKIEVSPLTPAITIESLAEEAIQ